MARKRQEKDEKQVLSHADLVVLAGRWLAKHCSVTVTEVVSQASETPDALGWASSWYAGGCPVSTLVECKANRADFLADRDKIFRKFPALGMGRARYFLGQDSVFDADEVPEGWGVLRPNQFGGVGVQKPSELFTEYNVLNENYILLSLLRRVGPGADKRGVSIKTYVWRTKNTAKLYLDYGDEIEYD